MTCSKNISIIYTLRLGLQTYYSLQIILFLKNLSWAAISAEIKLMTYFFLFGLNFNINLLNFYRFFYNQIETKKSLKIKNVFILIKFVFP